MNEYENFPMVSFCKFNSIVIFIEICKHAKKDKELTQSESKPRNKTNVVNMQPKIGTCIDILRLNCQNY